MDHLKFHGETKQDRMTFYPKLVYAFEDPDAKAYFLAMGWAEETADPADVTVTLDEINIDPETVWADGPLKGTPVMPERAAAARNAVEA